MKSRFVYVYVYAMFHQLVNAVEHAVGRERDVAVCRNHHFYLHASLYSLSKGLLQLVVEGEIWVDKLYAVLGIVDGIGVERSYNLCGGRGGTRD